MADERKFSLVMCSNNRNQAEAVVKAWQEGLADVGGCTDHVAMNMPSMAAGYNAALAQVKTPYVIFAHHDAYPLSTCPVGQKFLKHLESVDVLGFAGSHRMTGSRWFNAGPGACFGQVVNIAADPAGKPLPINVSLWERPAKLIKNIRVADGYCIVAKTEAALKIGWDERYAHFHLYDLDFFASACAEGFRTGVASDCYIVHQSRGSYSQPQWAIAAKQFVEKWDGNFDASYHDIGATFGTIQANDIRTVIDVLQDMETRMPDVVEL